MHKFGTGRVSERPRRIHGRKLQRTSDQFSFSTASADLNEKFQFTLALSLALPLLHLHDAHAISIVKPEENHINQNLRRMTFACWRYLRQLFPANTGWRQPTRCFGTPPWRIYRHCKIKVWTHGNIKAAPSESRRHSTSNKIKLQRAASTIAVALVPKRHQGKPPTAQKNQPFSPTTKNS